MRDILKNNKVLVAAWVFTAFAWLATAVLSGAAFAAKRSKSSAETVHSVIVIERDLAGKELRRSVGRLTKLGYLPDNSKVELTADTLYCAGFGQ